jgi:sugar lactone lactonase YvrE
MYVADTLNNRIRRVDENGVVSTVAGAGGATYDQDAGCLPDDASILSRPQAVTVDAAGNLYIADSGKRRVRKIAPDGTASDVVTAATEGFDAAIFPVGVAVDGLGNIWVADAGRSRVVEIGPNGTAIQSVGVAATGQIAFDPSGNLLIPTTNGVVYVLPLSPFSAGTGAPLAAASTSLQGGWGSRRCIRFDLRQRFCCLNSDGRPLKSGGWALNLLIVQAEAGLNPF